MTYNPGNIFARILRGEIPCNKVYEDAHTLAFRDIAPRAPVHVLIIPKGAYTDMSDFSSRASEAEIAAFTRAIGTVAKAEGLDKDGYRLISNSGLNGGQEVPHVHIHLLGGRALGSMIGDMK